MTFVFLFPLFDGLILLPLDLLLARHNPWNEQTAIFVKNPFMQDSIIQMYPWRYLVFESLAQGVIPFWNPYPFMGTPFMASMKPMVFYPFTLLLFALGPVGAWNILHILQIALALFFTYLFLRTWNLPPLFSLFGSMVFGLNTLMIGVLEFGSEGHVLLWFPLAFYAVKKFIDTTNYWFLTLLGLCLGSSILAGQFQYFIYLSFALGVFVLAYGYRRKITLKGYILLFATAVLGIGVSAVQLLPSIELLLHANRSMAASQQHFTSSLLSAPHYLRLFAPDLFGNPVNGSYALNYIEGGGYFGVIPLFFAVYAAATLWKRKLVRYCVAIIAVGILFSNTILGGLLAGSGLQLLTYGAGYRIFSLIYLPSAVLAGIGLYFFVTTPHHKAKVYAALFFLCFVVIFGYVFALKPAGILLSDLYFPALVMGVFALTLLFYFLVKKSAYANFLFVILLIAITYADLFRTGYRFLTYASTDFLYPKNELVNYIQDKTKDSLSRVYGFADPEVSALFAIGSSEIYNPLYLEKSRIFMQSISHERESNLNNASSFLLFPRVSPDLKRAVDAVGVGYLVTGIDNNPAVDYFGTDTFEPSFNPYIKRFARHDVFQNRDAHPRFKVVTSVLPAKNEDEAVAFLSDRNTDLKKYTILEQPPFIPDSATSGSATLISYDMNTAAFAVATNAKSYFYLSDTNYPGWSAFVNDVPANILSANYNFRAVEVPKGRSVVRFSYVPTHFTLGVGITMFSLVVLLLAPLLIGRKHTAR